MRSPSGLARFAVPVLLSLALHGLFMLGLWQLPAAPPTDGDLTQVPSENEYILGLDDAPPQPAAPVPKRRDDGPVVQASFDVRLVEPPPAPSAPLSPIIIAAAGHGPTGTGPAFAPPSRDAAGGGIGDGNDPAALAVGKSVRTIVYVVDHSMSMGFHGALARARREVLASLRRLPPGVHFQVIAYNREAEPLAVDGRAGLLSPDENTLRQVAEAVSALRAAGGTDHGRALRRAISFHPDLLYFLTDADDLNPDDVRLVTRLNERRTVIHTVELSGGASRPDGPLHKLAADNGGTYRRIDPEE